MLGLPLSRLGGLMGVDAPPAADAVPPLKPLGALPADHRRGAGRAEARSPSAVRRAEEGSSNSSESTFSVDEEELALRDAALDTHPPRGWPAPPAAAAALVGAADAPAPPPPTTTAASLAPPPPAAPLPPYLLAEGAPLEPSRFRASDAQLGSPLRRALARSRSAGDDPGRAGAPAAAGAAAAAPAPAPPSMERGGRRSLSSFDLAARAEEAALHATVQALLDESAADFAIYWASTLSASMLSVQLTCLSARACAAGAEDVYVLGSMYTQRSRAYTFTPGGCVPGQVWTTRRPLCIPDTSADLGPAGPLGCATPYVRDGLADQCHVRSLLFQPLGRGVLELGTVRTTADLAPFSEVHVEGVRARCRAELADGADEPDSARAATRTPHGCSPLARARALPRSATGTALPREAGGGAGARADAAGGRAAAPGAPDGVGSLPATIRSARQ